MEYNSYLPSITGQSSKQFFFEENKAKLNEYTNENFQQRKSNAIFQQ